MTLQPGEWHLYLDTPLPTPDTDGTLPILVNVGCTDPWPRTTILWPRPTTACANTKQFCSSTWAICLSIQLAFTWLVRSKPGRPRTRRWNLGRTAFTVQRWSPKWIRGAIQIPERQRLGHGRGRACRLRGVQWLGRVQPRIRGARGQHHLGGALFCVLHDVHPGWPCGLYGWRLLWRRNGLGCGKWNMRVGRHQRSNVRRRSQW